MNALKLIPWCVSCIQLLLLINVCIGEEKAGPDLGAVSEAYDSLTIKKGRCWKVIDTTASAGFSNKGPVAWIGSGDRISTVLLATFGEQDFILHQVYEWKRNVERSTPVLAAPINARSGLFEFPNSAMWFKQSDGVRIQELPEGDHEPIKIQYSEPITDIVAGCKSMGYVVQRWEDGELWVWDLKASTVLHVFKTKIKIQKVMVSHDGMRIAAVGMPFVAWKSEQPLNAKCAILFVWDLRSPASPIYQRNLGHSVWTLDFSPNDRQLLCSGMDGVFSDVGGRSHVTVIEPKVPSWSQSYEFNTMMILSACFLDNDLVAVGTIDDRIMILDMKQQKVVVDQIAGQQGVYSLQMNQGQLLSGGKDGTICEWDLSSGQQEKN